MVSVSRLRLARAALVSRRGIDTCITCSGAKPRWEVLHTPERLKQQDSAPEQDDREGNLAGDEEAARASIPAAQAGTGGVLEDRLEVHASGAKRGQDPKENHGEQRYRKRDGKDPGVGPDFVEPWERACGEVDNGPQAHAHERHAGGGSNGAVECGFGEKLADDAAAARANGGADGQLALARVPPRQ